ncbi:hypothetical protein M4R22_10935 [Acidovorax sp. GBBC 3334]|uniref:hypothetical protein n=1 Tax=Acidovorax sp. GBBC 3334 TaxID=2940496 RepID=UPI002304A59D|nr:hypothetical protein [Acidovorax sp. GBBC 3334]MDA8455276.1 hypothetical protein [Acidovorax sp. GBBC 3334]
MKRREMFHAATAAALWLASCGARAADPARLDERGLVAAVGKKVVRRYKLDDGHGLSFRTDEQPDFKLEFRRSRVNVVWMTYRDAGMQTLNVENTSFARKAFTYALGDVAADKIMRAMQAGERLQFERDGYVVNAMAPAGGQTLVTLSYSSIK